MTRPMAVRLLAASLCAGAAWDVFFGLGALYFPGAISSLTGIAVPGDRVFLSLCGVLLLILAGFYLVSARALRRAPELAGMAAAGRFLGFLFFLRVWWGGHATIYLVFGLVDLLFAAAHAALLCRAVCGSEDSLEEPRTEPGA